MLRPLLISLSLIVTSEASYKSLLHGRSRFENETEVEKFLLSLKKLNQIQGELFGVESPQADDDGKSFLEKLDNETPSRPDLLPYLYEGDIILSEEQMSKVISTAQSALDKKQGREPRPTRSVTSDLGLRWSFPIPYWIDTSTGIDSSAVQEGIAEWQRLTCARFTQTSYGTSANSLQFIRGNGCYSYIGMTGGVQQVSIGTGCTQLGTVTHEIGHALGFFHEQSRPERDNYVQVQTQNIENQYLSQFSKQAPPTVVNYGVEYNYGSVMHYDGFGFSSNGGSTIATLDPNYQSTIGQREAPSFADVKQINFEYCNSTCAGSSLNCQSGGYPDPNNCAVCRCPDGLGGRVCDQVQTSTSSSCGNGNLAASSSLQTLTVSGDADCYYRITAPAGRKVYIQFAQVLFPNFTPCTGSFAEIKYKANFVPNGFRVCGSNQPTTVTSQGNTAIIIYKGSASTQLSIQYRYDPTTPVAGQTTASPGWQTTTAAPTTWAPIPQTTQPPVQPGCYWTSCTANCGGCGTQSLICGGGVESTQYCGLTPCGGSGCCLPFTFDRSSGLCHRRGGRGDGRGGGRGGRWEEEPGLASPLPASTLPTRPPIGPRTTATTATAAPTTAPTSPPTTTSAGDSYPTPPPPPPPRNAYVLPPAYPSFYAAGPRFG